MSSFSDPSTLIKNPACVAISGLDRNGFLASCPQSGLDALSFARDSRLITKECFEAPLSIVSPQQYTAALTREIRTSAEVGRACIYTPSEVMGKTIGAIVSKFQLNGEVLKNVCRIFTERDQLLAATSEARSWVIVISPYGNNRPADPYVASRRHLQGSPIVTLDINRSIIQLMSRLSDTQRLRTLGNSSEIHAGSSVQLMQSTSLHENGSCMIDSALLHEVAEAFNSDSITLGDDLSQEKLGFLASYNADDFARMLRKPGCKMNLMRLHNTVLGYSVSYLDPKNLPLHGQRLAATLESYNLLPEGAVGSTVGFVDLIHVPDLGRKVCQIAGTNPTQTLHQKMVEDARAVGMTHLVGQTREFPHPNGTALNSHKVHGWRDAGVTLLYPSTETENGWQYSLGRVLILDLRARA